MFLLCVAFMNFWLKKAASLFYRGRVLHPFNYVLLRSRYITNYFLPFLTVALILESSAQWLWNFEKLLKTHNFFVGQIFWSGFGWLKWIIFPPKRSSWALQKLGGGDARARAHTRTRRSLKAATKKEGRWFGGKKWFDTAPRRQRQEYKNGGPYIGGLIKV
jgi:hypothetical protein